MKKVIFVADIFSDALNGGAENNDSVLIEYLLKNDRLMAGIAQKIKFIKDQIEEANNDVHRWGFE